MWLPIYVPGLPSGANNFSTIYTAPAGRYWRLLYFELVIAPPTTSYYVAITDSGGNITGNIALPLSGGGFATTGPHTLPGNGIKAPTQGDAFKIFSTNGAAYTLYGTVGLYVGH